MPGVFAAGDVRHRSIKPSARGPPRFSWSTNTSAILRTQQPGERPTQQRAASVAARLAASEEEVGDRHSTHRVHQHDRSRPCRLRASNLLGRSALEVHQRRDLQDAFEHTSEHDQPAAAFAQVAPPSSCHVTSLWKGAPKRADSSVTQGVCVSDNSDGSPNGMMSEAAHMPTDGWVFPAGRNVAFCSPTIGAVVEVVSASGLGKGER